MSESPLAQQKRAAKTALLLALLALGAILAAAIVYGGTAWWLIPVFLLGIYLGGRLASKTFGLMFGTAQVIVAKVNARPLGTPPSAAAIAMAERQARAERIEAGKPTPPTENPR